MSSFCAVIAGICMFVFPVIFIIFIVSAFMRKKLKTWIMSMVCVAGLFVLSVIVGVATDCRHEYIVLDEAVATCEENGFALSRCTLCGYEKKRVDKAKGHTMQEAKEDVNGTVVSVCSICGHVDAEALQASVDNEDKIDKVTIEEEEPVSTENQVMDANAEESVTESDYVNEATAGHVHSYTYTVVEEATFLRKGIEKGICSDCGDVKQRELAKLGTKENPGKVTVEQMVSEIKANAEAASEKYNGQWIEITGTVLDASNVAGMTRFCLYGNGSSGMRIVCWVYEEALKPFEYRSEIVTFLGQVREITATNATEIGDCRIISE